MFRRCTVYRFPRPRSVRLWTKSERWDSALPDRYDCSQFGSASWTSISNRWCRMAAFPVINNNATTRMGEASLRRYRLIDSSSLIILYLSLKLSQLITVLLFFFPEAMCLPRYPCISRVPSPLLIPVILEHRHRLSNSRSRFL